MGRVGTHRPPGGDPPGQGRPYSASDLLRRESTRERVPDVLLEESFVDLGTHNLDASCYVDPEYARAEMRTLWPRVWQVACRVEDVASVGDHIVYDVGDHSVVVVRAAADEIKAFHNSCLHRGSVLCRADGHAGALACGYHGWTWNLDGTLRAIPAAWDFPHVDPAAYRLPECRVGTWAGFVFVNLDPDAEPLEDHLGVLPDHFAAWDYGSVRTVARIGAVLPCNWKVAVESTLEGYHGPVVHPQFNSYFDAESTQTDIYGDNVSRNVALLGIAPFALTEAIGEQGVADAMAKDMGWTDVAVPAGGTAREALGEAARRHLAEMTGADLSEVSTVELIDNVIYSLFPNFSIIASKVFNLAYRWRPYGDDPDRCIVELFLMGRVSADAPAERVTTRWLDGHDWTQAPELGPLAGPLNQDMDHLAGVQRGLKASARRTVTLGAYQEARIRHFRERLAAFVRSPEPAPSPE